MRALLASKWMPLPHILLIEITSRCNLRCRMCPRTHDDVNTAKNTVMSPEIFARLHALFPYLSHVELSGLWGEAFLVPDTYFHMLSALKRHPIEVSTISNGTLIGDALARQLVDGGLDRLVVSMDAARPETYADIRPPGKLEDVLAGLNGIKEWKAKLGKATPRLELAFLGMRRNIEEFPDFVRLAHELGADKIFLQALGEYEQVAGESVAKNYKELGRRIADEAAAVARELGIELRLQPADQFEEDRAANNAVADFRHLRKDCVDLWTKAIVTTMGEVRPCCSSKRPIGRLLEQSFADIWYGAGYRALRRRIKSANPPPMCVTCTGMPWVPHSRRKDARQAAYWAGIELKRRYGDCPVFHLIKPALKGLRGLAVGDVSEAEKGY
ncbi:MAG: radical SAM protein [Kiritimatiellae bacterium]|nr:radical SAM protein [Kiritimatiellia bacterium]